MNSVLRGKRHDRLAETDHSIDNQAPVAPLLRVFSVSMVSRPTNNGGPVMWQRGPRCHSIGIPLHCNGASVATQRGLHCNTTKRAFRKRVDYQQLTKRAGNSQIFGPLACWWSGSDSRARSRDKKHSCAGWHRACIRCSTVTGRKTLCGQLNRMSLMICAPTCLFRRATNS